MNQDSSVPVTSRIKLTIHTMSASLVLVYASCWKEYGNLAP